MKPDELKTKPCPYELTAKSVAASLGGITESEADVILHTLTDKKSVLRFSTSTNPVYYVKAGTVTAIIMDVRRKFPYGTLASAVRTRYNESLRLARALNCL